ncbi:MAG: NAD(P)/FAD-dependent oxidoreductase [Halocynthiibacter sp.]
MKHIVVIGAGQAGSACVSKLRNLGFDGQITMIGAEKNIPYQRPPLSKAYLLGDMALERMFLRPRSYYDDNDITLMLDTKVDTIDTAAKRVEFGGQFVDYDALVLATGSAPNRLPAKIGGDLKGVHVMRSLEDADALSNEITEGKHVLIVGGGYIGLEAAAVAAKKGLKVTLVEMADRILERVAAKETSDFFRDVHVANGVDIREGTGLSTLIGEDHVTGAELSDGTLLAVDFVVVGVGVTPGQVLAEKAGLTLENGIKTDAFGQTSDPSIWSAGDCASFPYRGSRVRLESVPNAIDQAEIVAENILGAKKDYVAKPWFWSDQYDVRLQIAGLNTGYDDVVVRKGAADHAQSNWYFKGDELLAVDAMNEPRTYMVAKRMIEAGKTVDKAALADPDLDLKSLL